MNVAWESNASCTRDLQGSGMHGPVAPGWRGRGPEVKLVSRGRSLPFVVAYGALLVVVTALVLVATDVSPGRSAVPSAARGFD